MVGIHKKHKQTSSKEAPRDDKSAASNRTRPELAKRAANRKSTIVAGRTIGETRERLETKNERAAARKKDKQKKAFRISFTTFCFLTLGIVLVVLGINFLSQEPTLVADEPVNVEEPLNPTIEIIDEDAAAAAGKITNRMTTFIGQFEHDLRSLGYTPVKAVVPSGAIRQVNFYLEGYTGFIKTTIDRGSAVTAEDTDRLIRHLASQGIADFQYLDVRTQGKAFWK